MADEIDRANEAAQIAREAQVSLHLARARQLRAPPRYAKDGRRLCVDCSEAISPQRLAVVPRAVACLDCETIAERRQRQYRPGTL